MLLSCLFIWSPDDAHFSLTERERRERFQCYVENTERWVSFKLFFGHENVRVPTQGFLSARDRINSRKSNHNIKWNHFELSTIKWYLGYWYVGGRFTAIPQLLFPFKTIWSPSRAVIKRGRGYRQYCLKILRQHLFHCESTKRFPLVGLQKEVSIESLLLLFASFCIYKRI